MAGPIQGAVGGPDEERALRKKKKSKEDDRFAAVKSAIIKRLGDTCDVRILSCANVGKIQFLQYCIYKVFWFLNCQE